MAFVINLFPANNCWPFHQPIRVLKINCTPVWWILLFSYPEVLNVAKPFSQCWQVSLSVFSKAQYRRKRWAIFGFSLLCLCLSLWRLNIAFVLTSYWKSVSIFQTKSIHKRQQRVFNMDIALKEQVNAKNLIS